MKKQEIVIISNLDDLRELVTETLKTQRKIRFEYAEGIVSSPEEFESIQGIENTDTLCEDDGMWIMPLGQSPFSHK